MKRIVVLLLVLSLCVSLCACGKSADAKKVDEKILAIGEVTLGSKAEIEDALNSYNALTEEEKTTIENLDILKKAQVSYLEVLIASIQNIRINDKETLLQAQNYYESLSPEQQHMGNFQEELEKLEKDYAELEIEYARQEAFEELKELIRTKGTAIKEGGVNNSDKIVKWVCNGIELDNQYGSISYSTNMAIEDTDDFYENRTLYYPETWISMSIRKERFDVYFHSMFNAFASSNDIDIAKGKMNDIMYENYAINGELPDITDFSSNYIAMIKYDTPFDTTTEYGEYIRGCIHEEICSILATFKTELGFDLTRLGFSADVAKGIE